MHNRGLKFFTIRRMSSSDWKHKNTTSTNFRVTNKFEQIELLPLHRPAQRTPGQGAHIPCVPITKRAAWRAKKVCSKTSFLATWWKSLLLIPYSSPSGKLWNFHFIDEKTSSERGWFKEHALGLGVDAGRTGPWACTLQWASLLCSAEPCGPSSWPPSQPLSACGLQGHCFLCLARAAVETSALLCHPVWKPRFPLPENSQRVICWRGTAFTFRLNAQWSFVETEVWLKMRAQWLSSKNELMEKKQKSEILFKCLSLSLPFC